MDWKESLGALLHSGDIPQDNSPETPETSEPQAKQNAARQTVNVVYERKGRGGKPATIIEGFTIADNEVAAIAGRLKTALGVGGSARGGEILLQGDQRTARLKSLLEKEGCRVKGLK